MMRGRTRLKLEHFSLCCPERNGHIRERGQWRTRSSHGKPRAPLEFIELIRGKPLRLTWRADQGAFRQTLLAAQDSGLIQGHFHALTIGQLHAPAWSDVTDERGRWLLARGSVMGLAAVTGLTACRAGGGRVARGGWTALEVGAIDDDGCAALLALHSCPPPGDFDVRDVEPGGTS